MSRGILFLAVQVFWTVTVLPALAQNITKGPLVVMGDKAYPPYESLVDGEPVGVNVDLLREIAKVVGRPLDLRLYQWADAQARVRRGEAKVLSFMNINKERTELYDFTKPTFTSRYPVFVDAGKVDQFDVSDLTGKRIAVKRGGFPRTIIETIHPEAEMVFVDSALEGFRKLLRGEVEGVMEDERVGYTILHKNDFQGIRATAKALAVKTAHIAVVKGNPALLRQIDEALGEIKASGKFDLIAGKWASLDTVVIKRETIIFIVASGLVAIVLIVSFCGVIYVVRVRRTNLALRKEIVERKRAEEVARRLAAAIESLSVSLALYDSDDKLIMCNEAFRKLNKAIPEASMPGVSFEEHVRAIAENCLCSDAAGKETEWIQERVARHRNPSEPLEVARQGGTWRLVYEKRLPDGGIATLSIDITKQKRAEKALRESEERFRALFDNSPAAIYLKDRKERYMLVNKQYENIFGVGSNELTGKTAFDIFPKEIAEIYSSQDRKVLASGTVLHEETEIVYKDGNTGIVLITKFPIIGPDGKVEGVGGINVDITDRKQGEKIKATLAEKEILLKEIHHRVKNNLQVICSMLSLQAGTETDDRSIEVLEDSQRRVMVMARIHENLHRSDDLTSIDARDYLNAVLNDTIASSGHDAQGISFRLDGDDIIFDVDHAVVCGQIVSELLSNSLKHAFPKGQSGDIEVSLHRVGGSIELTVADDGKGLPQDFDFRRAETLGMRLIHALTMQLSGVVKVDGSGGTRVRITFPEQPS